MLKERISSKFLGDLISEWVNFIFFEDQEVIVRELNIVRLQHLICLIDPGIQMFLLKTWLEFVYLVENDIDIRNESIIDHSLDHLEIQWIVITKSRLGNIYYVKNDVGSLCDLNYISGIFINFFASVILKTRQIDNLNHQVCVWQFEHLYLRVTCLCY